MMTQKKYLGNSPKLNELREQKKNKVKRKFIFILVIFIIFITGCIFLSNWKDINIQTINISGNKIVDTADIEKIVNENISGKYLYLIPKSNGLLYPKNKILKEINEKYKRIESIDINTKDFQSLDISITENKAHYTWCGSVPFTQTDDNKEQCYFLNNEGYVFDTAPYFSGNVYTRFYGSIKTKDYNPIGFYFSPKNFNNLILLQDTLDKINLEVYSIFVKDDGDTEIFLGKSLSNDNPKILFKTEDNILNIIQNLKASVSADPLKSRIEKEYSSLLYIDLRFDNKVYYKFK